MADEEIDAMEAGREMDALVAEMVMGWRITRTGVYTMYHDPQWKLAAPDYEEKVDAFSTDIAAAWLVVEKIIAHDESDRLEFEYDYGEWTVGKRYYDGDWMDRADGKTFMLAVCRYALKCCKSVADKKEEGVMTPSGIRLIRKSG